MPGIACQTVDIAGGVQLGGGQSKLRIRGQLAVVIGDPVAGHGLPPHSPQPSMVTASDRFFVEGKPVCRAGDVASCGHATTGRNFFSIP